MVAKQFLLNCIEMQARWLGKAFLGIALLISSVAVSQTEGGTLTLSKALEIAASNYGKVIAKDFYAKAEKENLKMVKREYIPAFKLQGQLDYATANSLAGTYFPYGFSTSGGRSNTNNFDPVFGAIGSGYVEWRAFSFGQYRARVHEADLKFQIFNADAEQESFYNKVYLTQAYLDALIGIRLKELQQKNLDRALIVRSVVVENTKNGLRPGVDTSFVNAEVSRARLNLLEAEKNEDEQRRNLSNLMGIALNTFKLDTALFFQRLPVMPSAVVSDVSANPMLKIYTARQSLSEMRGKEIFRNYFPKVSVLGIANGRGSGISNSGAYDYSLGGALFTRFNYGGGITCTFNILDYPRMRAEQTAERFRTDAAKAELEQETMNLKNESDFADQKLAIALEQMKEAPFQYASASDFYRQKLAMYSNGLSTIVDISQSLYALSRAETDAAIARDAVWKALLNKSAVTGDFNLFLNSIR
jgi:outer membrane protein TolC